MDDWPLLQDYVGRNSEAAFRTLVNRYLGLVHAAASRQVQESQLAEEVTQAVFTLLARQASRLNRSVVLPGWLIRTTRHVAANARRAEQRRRRREQEAAMMQTVSNSEGNWAAIAPVLDEALDQLGVSDRNAILVHYLSGHSFREMSQSLGISEGAAKKRVSRALERLRVFLAKRGFRGSASALAALLLERGSETASAECAATVASVAMAHNATATTSLPPLVKATIELWRWSQLKLVGGVTVSALALVFLVSSWFPKVAVPANRPRELTPSTGATATRQSPRVQTRNLASVSPMTTNDLLVRALDVQSGVGLVGAKLFVQYVHGWKWDRREDLFSDKEGRCSIPLAGEDLNRLDVGVLTPGYVFTCYTWRSDTDGPIPAAYDLKLDRGVAIGGYVQDTAGTPIPGVKLEISSGLSDSNVKEPRREQFGFPANVSVAETDPTGRWVFSSMPSNQTVFYITARHPAFLPKSIYTDADDRHFAGAVPRAKLSELRNGSASMVLERGITVTGRVTDQQQHPFSEAMICAGSWIDPFAPKAFTQPDGTFTLTNIAPGTLSLTVTAVGYAPEQTETDAQDGTVLPTISLRPGTVLKLRVLDEFAASIPDVRISIEKWRGRNTLGWTGMSDDQGLVEWRSAPGEWMSLTAMKRGYCFTRNYWIQADGQEHTLTLRHALKVSGWVIDGESQAPVLNFNIIPGIDSTNWQRGHLRRSTDGQYSMSFYEYHPPYGLLVEAEGYVPASKVLESYAGEQICNFELKRSASPRTDVQKQADSIQGLVLSQNGQPIQGAEVALCTFNKGVSLGQARIRSPSEAYLQHTDEMGQFTFPPQPDAHTVVVVHRDGLAQARVNPPFPKVILTLQSWGRIEGILQLTGQSTAQQKIVLLLEEQSQPGLGAVSLDSMGSYSVETDEQGHFAFETVPPGQLALYLNRGVGVPFALKTWVDVKPGQTTQAKISDAGWRVVGRLVAPGLDQSANWAKQKVDVTLHTKPTPIVRPPNLEGDALKRWHVDFANSDEGRARQRSVYSCQVELAPDGSFKASAVRPGTYQLDASLFDRPVDPFDLRTMSSARLLGACQKEIIVPELPAGENNPSYEAGLVTMNIFGTAQK
jgi:RNA polymerase sigma factor (sigma-70 family)